MKPIEISNMKEYPGPKRLRYFSGRLLTAADLETEQEYFRGKMRRHNRYAHGWGVVEGLEVSIRRDRVRIEPGMAIDCAGQELVLEEPVMLRLPPGTRSARVVIEYFEKEIGPAPDPCVPEPGDYEAFRNSLVQEGCRVGLHASDPASDHDGPGPGTHGCGRSHPVAIARLRGNRGAWEIELPARRQRE